MFKKLRCILLAVLIVLQSFATPGILGMVSSAATSKATSSVVKITKQPKSVVVEKGKTAKVTLKASGSGLKYSWYFKDTKAKKYTRASAKSTSYSIKMSSKYSGRKVYCVVKNSKGKSVKSKVVTLKMGTFAKITTQPKSVTRPSGMTAKVTVTAKGDGLSYKWYIKNSGKSKYSLAKSFKGKTYSVKMTSKVKGRKVYCVVKDKYGNSKKSKVVTLTLGKTLKVTSPPASVKLPSGMKATVKVTASGDGLSYKWYYKNKGASKFTLTKSFKGSTYSATMAKAVDGRQVYCVVTDKYGKTVKTKTATLTLGKTIKITKQPASVKLPSGMKATVKVTASGDGLTYKWYYKNKGASKFTLLKSAKSSSYSVEMSKDSDGRQVYCLVTDTYGKTAKSATVTLTLGKTLKIEHQPQGIVLPAGDTAKVELEAYGDGLKYQWYFKDSGETKFLAAEDATKAVYSVEMTKDINGRELYCVVTDTYGVTVKTDVVKLTLGATLQITKQPESVVAHEDYDADVTFTAYGDGLTYQWYYKDKGDSEFSLSDAFTSNDYSVVMTPARDGRQLYCVVTDTYGKTVTTDVVTITSSHEMSDFETYLEATVEETGIDRSTCAKCSYYEDRVTPKLEAVYFITVNPDNGGDSYKVGVADNGKYDLKAPKKIGYNLEKWIDAEGNDFAAKGEIFKDIEITAVWGLDGTNTFKELTERAEAGVDKINITSDIVITAPVYFCGNTVLYSDADYSLIRDPQYDGDILVVGENAKGESVIWQGNGPKLTLGGGEGTLTVDGNKENTEEITVVGALLFANESAKVDIQDGIRLANNRKLGNKRSYVLGETTGKPTYATKRVGGAGVVILDATVNMYGGIIENNSVATEYTVEPDEQGVDQNRDYNACGGGVYSCGTFKMYGGVIRGNEALRGGGLYYDRYTYLYSGEISENSSTYYGGGASSSSSMNANLHVGTTDGEDKFILRENYSLRAGGAIYSNTSSPIDIHGNTELVANRSESSGGAIYTAGPLTISDAVFDGNSCVYSGGAIYHHYTKAEFHRRELTLSGTTFKNNQANLGGAIALSNSGTANAEAEDGTLATVSDCEFSGNKAQTLKTENEDGTVKTQQGNGGAIYVTRLSDIDISDSSFIGNSADNNAGAIAMHSESTNKINNTTFKDNTATYGGATYTSSGADLTLKDVTFRGNKALAAEGTTTGGNGGAMFIAEVELTEATLSFDNVDFKENHADGNAGAIYQNSSEITVDETCEFEGNTALGHGGAIYLTYKKLNDEAQTKVGSRFNANDTIFKNNSAMAGGVISIRTDCVADFNNVTLEDNSATGTGEDASGGGAVYVGFGELNLTEVTATQNTSAGHGGVINSVGSTVTVNNSNFSNNSAPSAGVINAVNSSVVELTATEFTSNSSTYENTDYNNNYGGGAINTSSSTLNINDVIFDGNTSSYYGGTILSYKTEVTMQDNTVVKNSRGSTGGALYFRGGSTAELTGVQILDNTASANGVIYANATVLNMDGVTASGNKANRGGVIYTSGETTEINTSNSSFSHNSADHRGGAIYSERGTLTVTKVDFSENSAENHGGAISLHGATLTTDDETTFTGNTAGGHGGAVNVLYVEIEVPTEVEGETKKERINGSYTADGTAFSGNSALGGGAVSIRSGCQATLNQCTLTDNSVEGYDQGTAENPGENDGDSEGGGAVYVGYGTVTLNGVTATGNTASDFGGVIDSVCSTVTIQDGSFDNNSAANGGAIYGLAGTTLNITGATFSANNSTFQQPTGSYDSTKGGGAINLNKGELTIRATTFDGNTSSYYGGAVLSTNAPVSITENTIFKNSQGATGTALNMKNVGTATISDTTFQENVSTGNGVVYMNNGTYNLTNVIAENNSAYNGGVIYTSNPKTTINLTNCTIRGNSATATGGVVYADDAKVNAINSTISGNSAKTGGALYSIGGALTVSGSLENNTATYGAAIYTEEGTLEISDAAFRTNSSTGNGGAVYARRTPTTITNVAFESNISGSNGGAFYLSGNTATVSGDTQFLNNTAEGHGGAVYVVYDKVEVPTEVEGETKEEQLPAILNATGINFDGNSAKAGGVASARTGCEINLTDCSLTNNSVEGCIEGTEANDGNADGGGAIYVGFGEVTLTNCTATGNTSSDFGGVIDSLKSTVTIEGGVFSENKGNTGGVIYALSGSTVNISGTTFSYNESVYDNTDYNSAIGGGAIAVKDGTLNVKNSTLEGNKTGYYGGAIHSSNSTVSITDNTVIRGNTGTTGAALYFRDSTNSTIENTTINNNTAESNGVVYQNGGTMTLDNINAYENTAASGGVLFVSGSIEADLIGGTYDSNTAVRGGALFVGGGTVNTNATLFQKNEANLGGAAYTEYGTFKPVGTTFRGNRAVANAEGKNGNGGAISIEAGKLEAVDEGDTENTFESNTAAGHGGVVYVTYKTADDGTKQGGTADITGGLMQNNTALAGGAISSRTSSNVMLNGTVLKNNEATGTASSEGGGAIYGNNNTITLTGVVMDGNKTGYYGGAVTALASVFTINGKSQVTNNIGVTGVAFNFREAGTNVIDDVTVSGCTTTANGSGNIYITGNGTLDITKLTATDNENNNGGVIYASGSTKITVTDSIISGNTARNAGGAIYHTSSGTLDVVNTTIENNTTKYGGAIFAIGKGLITIDGSTLKGNTVSEKGGAIYGGNKETQNETETYKPANILICNGTVIESNTSAKAGGAIHLDVGAVLEINDSEVKNNQATGGDGGAIYLADSSTDGTLATTLKGSGTTFIGNTTSAKGGAISTDTASTGLVIDLVGCTFDSNKALGAGGGAVEIQNSNQASVTDPEKVNLVFTGCTFIGNTSKTTGGAIEIRTSSAAKFDGITAKDNAAGGHGGVFYVTSNFSRLYLTGEVALENNTTSGSGTFAYLYNNNYSNPPKIYTTHANTAAWVGELAGNTSNVAYDLVTLP